MAVVEVPEATISRLPIYFRVLAGLSDRREISVSSERISELAGVNAATVRKDFSYLGSYGTRGVGYEVAILLSQIGTRLGMARSWPVVIAGAGNLGQALANYRGFSERGFPVLALLEVDESKVGSTVHGVPVRSADDLDEIVAQNQGCIGVVATPAPVAQAVVDRFVAAGIRSIMNFAPTVLTVPDDVHMRQVDLAVEMQVLSFHSQSRDLGRSST